MDPRLLPGLVVPAETKIVLLVMDGLGGLPQEPAGPTELETASTPNLDALAERSALGLTVPVRPGVSSGSGPGHLALFGYDPICHEIGRGALEALGVDLYLGPEDVAARGNFCTVDAGSVVTDRRAGRLANEASAGLVRMLRSIRVEGVDYIVEPVKEHRFAFVMRAPGLADGLTDTDPHHTGLRPLQVRATAPGSEWAAHLANRFVEEAARLLAGCHPANMILLRGFARLPAVPGFRERYGLRAAAIAVNGMYRGVARMVGMEVLPLDGITPADQFAALEKSWDRFDFFYLHVKQTDTAGEKGDFYGKVRVVEQVDALLPRLMALDPDVVIVSGDHSSPALLGSHSWHSVPTLLYSRIVRADGIAAFGERDCARGSLGILPARDVMPLALANARRLAKFGA